LHAHTDLGHRFLRTLAGLPGFCIVGKVKDQATRFMQLDELASDDRASNDRRSIYSSL